MRPIDVTDPASDESVDRAFAEVAARRAADAAHQRAWKTLWLAHHWPHRYERCAMVGGHHVCRRCLWFYSVSLLTLAAAALGISPWPSAWDSTLVWVLSIPATIEFIGGELRFWGYDAKRQIVVTSILGLAVGRGFHAELMSAGSWTFWGPVLVFGTLWFTVAAGAWLRNRGQYRE